MSSFMQCPPESRIGKKLSRFVWTGALNHVILLLFVLVVLSRAPNSMQPQCFFCVDNSKWRCWWLAEGRKVSREQKLGLEQTCQLACHTSCYVHTDLDIFFSNPGFVWTGALNHVILLVFVLVVVLTVRRFHCRRLRSRFWTRASYSCEEFM